jgi:hypothetical protein
VEDWELWTWGQAEVVSSTVAPSSAEISDLLELRLNDPQPEFSSDLPRRNLKDTPLAEFRKSNGKIKHEDFIIKICRRLTKSIKRVLKGKEETLTGLTSAVNYGQANPKLETFRQAVLRHRACLEPFISSDSLPQSKYRKGPRSESSFRSYNKAFMSHYLSQTPYLRIVYYYYCQAIFDGESDALCKAWRMSCCARKQHDKECGELWERLRIYTQSKLLEELGLIPFLP